MKLPRLLNTTACLLSAFSASAAFAHEGHGEQNGAVSALLHWFTGWDHAAVVGLIVIAVALCVRFARNAKKKELR